MLEDKTSKFVLFGGVLIILAGAFAPNWIVNQFMFGFSRALAIVGLMVLWSCLLYTSPSPRDYAASRMPSSA